jgi:hypothetical protein
MPAVVALLLARASVPVVKPETPAFDDSRSGCR